MKFYKICIGFILFLSSIRLIGQEVVSVNIGIDGLHCSACTFSVEKSLYKLDFVQTIIMDLNKREAVVTLKEDRNISYEALAKAVTKAGFSVRHLMLELDEGLNKKESCLKINKTSFCIVDVRKSAKKQNSFLQLIGKPFLSHKEYKIWKKQEIANCESCTADKMVYQTRLVSNEK